MKCRKVKAVIRYHTPIISDDALRQFVRSLNTKQREAYNIVLSWCRNTMKNANSLKPLQSICL